MTCPVNGTTRYVSVAMALGLSKRKGEPEGSPQCANWWRRRGIEPLVQRKTHPDLYKLSRRLCLARRTSTDGVTGGPAD
jgi:hypothetical protein